MLVGCMVSGYNRLLYRSDNIEVNAATTLVFFF